MKKFFAVAVLCLMGILSMQAQLQFVRGSFRPATGMAKDITNWHSDNTAVLIVICDNMPKSDINQLSIKTLSNGKSVAYTETRDYNGSPARWFFIPEHNSSFDIELSLPGEGTTTIPGITMRKKNAYVATVNTEGIKEGVDVIINSDPSGAEVFFDTKSAGTTPAVVKNVLPGTHKIVLKPTNMTTCEEKTATVRVDRNTNTFTYDLHRTGDLTITTFPTTAMVRVMKDGKELQKGSGDFTVNDLPFGTYTLKGNYGNDEVDVTVNFDNNTQQPIEVRVIPSRSITFTATQNNLPVNGADITLDGKFIGVTPLTYKVGYGVHNVVISTGAYATKQHTFTVSQNSKDPEMCLKLPNKAKKRHNIFDNYYNKREWGIAANYVSRSYDVKSPYDGTQPQNFWGSGKSDSGIQIGISYQGYYGYGQGFVTGLYYQGFFGKTDDYSDGSYTESSLFMPLQYQFRLPISSNFSIFVNAGVGLTVGLANQVKNEYGSDENAGYGYSDDFNRTFPGAFDCSLLFGGGLQFKAVQLEAKYGKGLSTFKDLGNTYDTKAKSRTFAVGLSLMF